MKKWFLGIILAIGFISLGMAAPTYAAGIKTAVSSPFNGTFTGIAYADYKTSAPLSIAVTQEGDDVTALINIEDGLKVNAGGFCGTIAIPASSLSASGIDTDDSADTLSTRIPFDIGGASVTAIINGEIDGDQMDVSIKVKTPFICGKSPVITGELIAQ